MPTHSTSTPSESDDLLGDLGSAVEAAEGTLARLTALSAFFVACEEILSSEDPTRRESVFQEAAVLRGAQVTDGAFWDWWREKTRGVVTHFHVFHEAASLLDARVAAREPVISIALGNEVNEVKYYRWCGRV